MALGGAGGGTAGAIEAGKANVVLGVKDNVSPDLRMLREKFKQFGSDTKNEIAKATSGTGFSDFLKGGVLGFGTGIAASALVELGKGLKDMIPGLTSIES